MTRGSSREVSGRFYARARYGKGQRLEVRVPWATTREEAESRASVIADLADRLTNAGRRDLVKTMAQRAADASTPEALTTVHKAVAAIVKGVPKPSDVRATTFKEFAQLWVTGELHQSYPDHVRAKDHNDDISRLRKYVYPHVAGVPLSAFTSSHAELVMSKLPAKYVRTPATRRHVAQLMGRILHLAVYPGRLIAVSPMPRGWLPKLKSTRHYSCLFPREEAMLLAHAEVPEVFRLFCGILNREGMRISELWDSEWRQWNLEEGTFTTARTKTSDPRMWAVKPDVVEAMRFWKKGRDKKRPFAKLDALVTKDKLAGVFRAMLKVAGIEREELFETTAHTGRLRAHDMRATFVTISLAEGRSDTWIRDRTAHKSTSMVDRYRRHSRQIAELKLGSLTDLVEGLGWGTRWGTTTASNGEATMATDENNSEVHGRGLEPLRLAAAEPKSAVGDSLATDGDEPRGNDDVPTRRKQGVPQASPRLRPPLKALAQGLALERSVWDELDLWEMQALKDQAS